MRLQQILINRERFWHVGYGDHRPKRVLRGHESAGTAIYKCSNGEEFVSSARHPSEHAVSESNPFQTTAYRSDNDSFEVRFEPN